MSSNVYHWCLVPECKNTSIKTPHKLWILVPSDIKMRNTWLKLARRDPKSLSTKSKLYFCEDHFDLENDMENYIKYKIMGSVKRIQMKPNSLPSRFDCQANRKRKSTSSEPRHAFIKRQRMSTLQNCAISLPSCSQDFLTTEINKCDDKVVQVVQAQNRKVIQVCPMKHYRSRNVQTSIKTEDSVTSPFKATVSTATSPFKVCQGRMSKICVSTPSATKMKLNFFENKHEVEVSYTPSITGFPRTEKPDCGSQVAAAKVCAQPLIAPNRRPVAILSSSDMDVEEFIIKTQESIGDTPMPDEYYIPTATHIDYACGACGSRIDGFRYSCVQCADYDQCAECEASGAHAEHYVLRVPRVERDTDLQTVLDRVRRELKQINIPVKPKLEKDDDEEIGVVVKEEVEEEVEPEEADPLQGAGAGVVKREDSDTDDSDTTSCGQVSVYETTGVPARVSEASSARAPTRKVSNIRSRAGKASSRSAVTAASEPADTEPAADQVAVMQGAGPGGGAVKQEAVEFDNDSLILDRATEATDVPLRAYEVSNLQAQAGTSRGRPPSSKLVNTPAPTGHEGEQPRDSKRQAGASRDVNLSELSTLKFDSMRAPRKRRKTDKLGD